LVTGRAPRVRVDWPRRGPSVDGRADSEQRASRSRHLVSAARRGCPRVPTNLGRGALPSDDGERRKPESQFPVPVGRGAAAGESIVGAKATRVDGPPPRKRTLREEPCFRTREPHQPSALPGFSRLRAPMALSLVLLQEAQPAPYGAQGSLRDRRGSREPTRRTPRVPSAGRCVHGGPDGRELYRLCVW